MTTNVRALTKQRYSGKWTYRFQCRECDASETFQDTKTKVQETVELAARQHAEEIGHETEVVAILYWFEPDESHAESISISATRAATRPDER